jgi:iron complex outermembrane receptor protein
MLRVLLILIILSHPIFSQSNEDKVEETSEIEVKGEIPDRLMTPDRQKILEEGIFDLSDSLYKEPGFSRIRRGGTNTDLIFRGHQKDNYNFLIDGQRMYGACPNRMDPQMSHLDLGAVEKFDVVRGPYDVKNPGSLGGSIQVVTKRPKQGLHSSGNTGVSSFGGNFLNADASYGDKMFSVLVGGSYSGMQPYRDGNGNRFTSVYNDVWDQSYILQNYTKLNPDQKSILNLYRDKAPGLFQTYNNPSPSSSRYRYSERDSQAYTRRGAWSTIQFRPVEDHELEIQFAKQEQDGVMYPYLSMDANYDHSTRARGSYTISNISKSWKKFKIEGYGSEVDHLMTDQRRCSSTADPFCRFHGTRPYAMSTDARSDTVGGKVEASFQLDAKDMLVLGIDHYKRGWNTVTTNRSRHFLNPLPMASGSMSMGHGSSMSGTPQPYREVNSIPDASTLNSGVYADYKKNLTEAVTVATGIRYDHTNSSAGKDRRALYNIYYPPTEYYQVSYQSFDILDRKFDDEIYIPNKGPQRTSNAISGYVKADWKIDRKWDTHGGVGHAVRPPDPNELYFAMERMGTESMPDLVGNPNLKNTSNSQVDAGVSFNNKKFRTEFNSYYSRVNGNIILSEINKNTGYIGSRDNTELAALAIITGQDLTQNNRYARSYRNVDSEIYGGEVTGLLSVTGDWYLGATASYTRGINLTEKRELPLISPLRGTLSLRWDIDTYFSELEGVFSNVQNQIDTRLNERRAPGYGIGNIKFGWKQDGMRIIAGVRNIFDRYYFDHLSYSRDFWSSGVVVPEPGRSYYLTFQWDL